MLTWFLNVSLRGLHYSRVAFNIILTAIRRDRENELWKREFQDFYEIHNTQYILRHPSLTWPSQDLQSKINVKES